MAGRRGGRRGATRGPARLLAALLGLAALGGCAALTPAAGPARRQLPPDLHLAHGGLSADGRQLLLVGRGGGGCFAPALQPAEGEPRRLAAVGEGGCGVLSAAASAGGDALAVQVLDAGTVHLFRRVGDGRLAADGVLPLPGAPGFPHPPPGRSLALSADGTALLAGSVERDCRRLASGAVRCGRADLYRRGPDGGWRLAASLGRPEGEGDAAHFGQSALLLPDGAALVGGTGVSGDAGALHLFLPRTPGGDLAFAQTLLPGDGGDEFYATDVAASGDGAWAAVGAAQAVHLYRRGADGRFAAAGAIEAPERRAGHFGDAVALDGDGRTLVVGAPRAPCGAGTRCGVAYRYARDGGGRWRLAGTLGPAREEAGANFGHEAALDATGAVSAVDGAGVTLETAPAR